VVFKDGTVDLVFMQKLAQFSKEDDGPIIAIDFLNKHGIKLIIEPHFS
ncbi:MAG: plasmid stabilization protein, partial [Flavobacteriales bacterium CG_4_9_14_3_um_filter_32_8]